MPAPSSRPTASRSLPTAESGGPSPAPPESAHGWQLEGSAAEAYQAWLVPAIFEEHAERLVEWAGVGPGDRVLDVACGTGVVSRAAAARVASGGAVTGLDVNPDMLATARRVGTPSGPPIRWERGDATDLPFDDGAFDVVLCEEALQFIGDRGAALREMKRVAAPGGRIAFSAFRSLDRHPVYAAFARLLGEHVGEDARAMMASPFALGDADVLRSLGREAGLADVRVRIGVGRERFPSVDDFVAREGASSPLAGPLGRLDAPARRALVAALEAELAPHLDDFGLAFSNETHVVTATA